VELSSDMWNRREPGSEQLEGDGRPGDVASRGRHG
jgi:hypothetical protein